MKACSKLFPVIGYWSRSIATTKNHLLPSLLASTARRTMSHGSKIMVNGVNMHYEKQGQGNHIVLLIPGALGSARTDFTPQLEKMNREKFTLIGWDPRGYGQSQPPVKTFSPTFLRDDAEDAVALMEALGYSCYSILGWSDGANVGAMMAANWSGRVCKLVVWGGNSYVTPEEVDIYKKIRDVSLWSPAMKKPMIDVYGETVFEQLWHNWVDTFAKLGEEAGTGNIDLYKKDLEKINCDTLILHGDKDPMVPAFQCEHLHKNIKGSRLVRWPDGKHNIHIKFADRFNKIVEEFLLQKVPSYM